MRKLRIARNTEFVPVFFVIVCVATFQLLIIFNQHNGHTGRNSKYVQTQREIHGTIEDDMSEQSCSCNANCIIQQLVNMSSLVFPVPARKKEFLTIGIPTIMRKGAIYILQTLDSLVTSMSPEERKEVVIVVFLGDTDPKVKQDLANQIKGKFTTLVDSGMLHITQVPIDFYPELKITKHTYGQSTRYITWRSKQNFDFAFLMEYSANLSSYYIQLEDDVFPRREYIQTMKNYIRQQGQSTWTCLEFSELGYIGKLYKSTDVPKLAAMLRLFYEEQPCDVTYLYFNRINKQWYRKVCMPTLFQHQSLRSSMLGKIQRMNDRFFEESKKKHLGDNPPAQIYTSMSFDLWAPEMVYAKTDGYFSTNAAPRKGDYFIVVFSDAQTLHRIMIETGSAVSPKDQLSFGQLELGLRVKQTGGMAECSSSTVTQQFLNGHVYFNMTDYKKKANSKIKCMKIVVNESQTSWLIIREIAVFTT